MAPELFRFYRSGLGLTQKQMAGVLRVSLRTIQRWESGQQPISGPADLAVRLLDHCCEIIHTGDDFSISNKFLRPEYRDRLTPEYFKQLTEPYDIEDYRAKYPVSGS